MLQILYYKQRGISTRAILELSNSDNVKDNVPFRKFELIEAGFN